MTGLRITAYESPLMNLQDAKKLFFAYDGFHFHMDRDGRGEEYRLAGVPREVEALWLEELKREKLHLLSEKGNWWVLHFFLWHFDFGHLEDFIRAKPRGELWQRTTFVEELLKYAGMAGEAGGDPALVREAVRKVVVEATRLLKRARAAKSIERVQMVLREAQQLERKLGAN